MLDFLKELVIRTELTFFELSREPVSYIYLLYTQVQKFQNQSLILYFIAVWKGIYN